MKHIILAVLFLAHLSLPIQAKKLFVEIEFHKNTIKLDDGSNKKPQVIKGEDGKDLKFTSLIGALNYMSLQGWTLENTKAIITGGGAVGLYGGSSATGTDVYYLFSKEVSDDELHQVVDNSYKKD